MLGAHDEVLTAILDVLDTEKEEIRLIGRINDPVINNASEKEVFFFIPDLHLITPERQKRFGNYGFNHVDSELLQRVLRKMAFLADSWMADNRFRLVTVQLGDFFDIWREFPRSAKPEEIGNAHADLRDILYRGRMRNKPCLKATMILGNHDTKRGVPLQEIPFQLKAFNRTDDERPFLFVTHGDAFDILEIILPDAIEEFAVYFVGDMTPINKYPVANWGKYAGKINKPLSDLDGDITDPLHSLRPDLGAPVVASGQALPPLLCQEIASPGNAEHRLFMKIYQALGKAEEKGLPGQYIRIAAVGHTHKASMTLCRPPDGTRPLVLMDVGAWIEKCQYPLAESGVIVTEPSAQLGIIHGNDARIYQLRVRESA